jgi:xylan 1,4-beta-xylosidase
MKMSKRWQFEAEKKVIKSHLFLKLKNINNTVDMFYSLDGIKWQNRKFTEMSSINYNAFGGVKCADWTLFGR